MRRIRALAMAALSFGLLGLQNEGPRYEVWVYCFGSIKTGDRSYLHVQSTLFPYQATTGELAQFVHLIEGTKPRQAWRDWLRKEFGDFHSESCETRPKARLQQELSAFEAKVGTVEQGPYTSASYRLVDWEEEVVGKAAPAGFDDGPSEVPPLPRPELKEEERRAEATRAPSTEELEQALRTQAAAAEQRRLAEAEERLRQFQQRTQEAAERKQRDYEQKQAEHRRQVEAAERARREHQEALARSRAAQEDYERKLREHAALVARLKGGASSGPQCTTSFFAGTRSSMLQNSLEEARGRLTRLDRRWDFNQCLPDTLNIAEPACEEQVVLGRRMFVCEISFNCQRKVCEPDPGTGARQE